MKQILATFFIISLVLISPAYAGMGGIDVPTEDAVEIGIVDAGGYFTGTEVEAALQEIGAGYSKIAAAESITGLWNFMASGLGGLGDYDVTVGDVTTPDYGIIRIGDSLIGRTSYNAGNLDLDGSVIFRNMGTPATSKIEFVFTESGASAIRFALAKSGVGNATYNPRCMLIAGPAVNNDDIVTVGYWQTEGIFHNLLCDTSGFGASLGVQYNLEVENDIFVDSIKESTSGAGITMSNKIIASGGLEVTNQNLKVFTNAAVWILDDHLLRMGSAFDANLVFETIDVNANELILTLPVGTAINVPVFVIGDLGILDNDFGWFNGITEPRIVLVDANEDSYIWMGHSADDTPTISTNQAGISFDDKNITDVAALSGDNATFQDAVNVPLIADRLTGSQDIFQLKDNGTIALKFNASTLRIDGVTHSKLTLSDVGGTKNAEIDVGDVSFVFKDWSESWFGMVKEANYDVKMFEDSTDAETKWFRIHGFPTGEALRYGQFQIIAGPKFQISSDSGEIDFADENIGIGGDVLVSEHTVTTHSATVGPGEQGFVVYTDNGMAATLTVGTTRSVFLFDDSGSFSIQARTRAQVLAGQASGADTVLEVQADGDVSVGTITPDSLFEVDGAEGLAIETVTGNTTLDKTHSTILVNASSNVIITLAPAADTYNNTDGIGRIQTVKKIDAGGYTVTLDPTGSEEIEFAPTAVITVQGESIKFQSNGTGYFIL